MNSFHSINKNKKNKTSLIGNLGLFEAMKFYGKLGYHISIPVNDITGYDLVVEYSNGILKKVQVKTTMSKRPDKRNLLKKIYRPYSVSFHNPDNNFNELFILAGDQKYLIYGNELVEIKKKHKGKDNKFALTSKYNKYKVM